MTLGVFKLLDLRKKISDGDRLLLSRSLLLSLGCPTFGNACFQLRVLKLVAGEIGALVHFLLFNGRVSSISWHCELLLTHVSVMLGLLVVHWLLLLHEVLMLGGPLVRWLSHRLGLFTRTFRQHL